MINCKAQPKQRPIQQAKTMLALLALISLIAILSACSHPKQLHQHNSFHAKQPHQANFYFDFKLHSAHQWYQIGGFNDAAGYSEFYAPTRQKTQLPQNIILHYGRDIKTPLLRTMQEINTSNKLSNCHKATTTVLTQNKNGNSLVFSNELKACDNNKSLWQVYKIFNRPDGQYAIIYTAEPRLVPLQTRQQIRQQITNTQLKRY